uniref:Ribosomal RNA methyltransferase FtsJ domain-containing protein n=1 Tax=Amphimedon queenslandica TaxID=400682 RepID=A0A1X7U3D7_AMPQE
MAVLVVLGQHIFEVSVKHSISQGHPHKLKKAKGSGVTKVVDLCAALGSWSQVLSKKLLSGETHRDTKIVAVDLQQMALLPDVIQIQGDITKESTAKEIASHFEGSYADLVVCDGAPDALNITTDVLSIGGTFVAKCIVLNLVAVVIQVLNHSSYVLHIVPTGYILSMDNPLLQVNAFNLSSLPEVNKSVVPFIACGDLSQFDSDMTYPIEEDCCLPPVQAPINPPYKTACTMKHGDIISAINRLSLEDKN